MQKTLCKKCGGFHTIDSYKTLRFYSCPVVNRVLLLSDEVKETKEVENPDKKEEGAFVDYIF